MVSKVCSRSHGQPVPGVRNAAMISSSRVMSREGVITRSTTEGRRPRTIQCLPPAVPHLRHLCSQASPAGTKPGRGARAALLLVAGPLGLAAGFEQEPAALFSFVDEILQKDRKSTRLNSSHLGISYAVFCLKKKTYK